MRTRWIAFLLIAILAPAALAARTPLISFGDDPNWSLGFNPPAVADTSVTSGSDAIGHYSQTSFHLQLHGVPLTEGIRTYPGKPIALFLVTYEAAAPKPLVAFPDFDSLPKNTHIFSYKEKAHAPASFTREESGAPWTVFDDSDRAFIISPAAHFYVETIAGDGKSHIRGELRDTVRDIPAGFTQQTLVAWGHGINHVWDEFGNALTTLGGKTRPANDADIGLKYLGYWTDNGTYYYYTYDKQYGYDGTLIRLADHFRQTQIPVKYMQLDSWWYYKSFTGYDGKPGEIKNANLPVGQWNRYGGLMEYRAHPGVFPDGLAEFQKRLGLPIITHNRWVDPASPYHQQYRITGLAAIDPGYWRNIVDYTNAAGAYAYEQDWLSVIYLFSPELSRSVTAGDAFADGMADACRANGMTMQYCMALPINFLEGSRLSNLTTIRPSNDRLKRDRWHDFLYGSRLAAATGIWPWTDSYRSDEVGNILLSDLSAGMVGPSDEIGKEDPTNIFLAVRTDGVIVKPDVPLMPVDSTYIAEATGHPRAFLASTFTDTDGVRTEYVLAFRIPGHEERLKGAPGEDLKAREQIQSGKNSPVQDAEFSLDDVNVVEPAYVYDFFDHTIHPLAPGEKFKAPLGKDGFNYYIVAQPGISGIALFGDAGKFVSAGKQRIPALHEADKQLTATVTFADGEKSVTLHGCCASPVKASVNGKDLPVKYDPASGHFTVDIDATGPATEDVLFTRQ